MSYFLWGCRGILTLITLRSERVKIALGSRSLSWDYRITSHVILGGHSSPVPAPCSGHRTSTPSSHRWTVAKGQEAIELPSNNIKHVSLFSTYRWSLRRATCGNRRFALENITLKQWNWMTDLLEKHRRTEALWNCFAANTLALQIVAIFNFFYRIRMGRLGHQMYSGLRLVSHLSYMK